MAKIKKRVIATLIVVGIIVGWIILGGSHAILAGTSTTEFCVSCHTMDTPYKEYQGSVHFSNAKGIRAECADCHIPQDTFGYLVAKIRATKDVYHEYITGKIDTDEKYEAHRKEMAERVWAQFRSNDSTTCRSCHTHDAMETFDQSEDAQKMHQYAVDNNQTCIDCHKGVAHIAPEIKLDSKALDSLLAIAKSTPTDAKVVFPIKTIAMGNLGTINPSTPLTVIDTKGSMRTVQIKGSQMQGAEQVLYMDSGKRAILAMLTKEGQQALTVGDFIEDSYGNKWRSAVLQTSIDTPVLADINPLWNYAKQLDNAYCSTCHAVIPASHFTVNAWPSVAKGMGDRTSISKEDLEILTKYFQYNAKDVVGH